MHVYNRKKTRQVFVGPYFDQGLDQVSNLELKHFVKVVKKRIRSF